MTDSGRVGSGFKWFEFNTEKGWEESTHSVTIVCCFLRHVSLGVATSPSNQIYRMHLNASSGHLKGTAPLVATPLHGSTASIRKKGSRTRNQENLPAFVCRFKLRHRFASSSALWARKCQHADQRIVSIPTFRTWAVTTRQIMNHPKLSG